MIIYFGVNYNNYKEKVLDNYDFWSFKSPCCQSNNSLTRHCTYDRHIFYFVDNSHDFQFISKVITVLRLKCSCGKTHAVLPEDIIPYGYYTVTIILSFLTSIFVNGESIKSVENNFNIPASTIYQYIAKYKTELFSIILFLITYLQIELDYNSSNKILYSLTLKIMNEKFRLYEFYNEYFKHKKSIVMFTRQQSNLYISMVYL